MISCISLSRMDILSRSERSVIRYSPSILPRRKDIIAVMQEQRCYAHLRQMSVQEPNQAAQTTPGLRPVVSDLKRWAK